MKVKLGVNIQSNGLLLIKTAMTMKLCKIVIIFVFCSGVFSWIAINYLVGRLNPDSHVHHVKRQRPTTPATSLGTSSNGGGEVTSNEMQYIHTVGSLDLGGASLQVAFEVSPEVRRSMLLTSCMSEKLS